MADMSHVRRRKRRRDVATTSSVGKSNVVSKSRKPQTHDDDDLETYFVFGGQKTADIREKYELGKELSRGGVGRVFAAKGKESGEACAVKAINKPPKFSRAEDREMFLTSAVNEVHLLKGIDHPNVVKLFDVFEDERRLYLVMEMCSGGELHEKIQGRARFAEKDAAPILRQIFTAVYYMHTQKVAHCDLKPENLMFSTRNDSALLKVVDFDQSKSLRGGEYLRSLCGTPYYVAPEVLRGHYRESCDLWSIGVIMFVMIFGFPPFYSNKKDSAKSAQEIHAKVALGFTPKVLPGYGAWFPERISASEGAKDLIKRLLVLDFTKRMTAQGALSHPWLNGESIELAGHIGCNL